MIARMKLPSHPPTRSSDGFHVLTQSRVWPPALTLREKYAEKGNTSIVCGIERIIGKMGGHKNRWIGSGGGNLDIVLWVAAKGEDGASQSKDQLTKQSNESNQTLRTSWKGPSRIRKSVPRYSILRKSYCVYSSRRRRVLLR